MQKVIGFFLIAIVILVSLQSTGIRPSAHKAHCLKCHSGIEDMDESHRFECTQCHFLLDLMALDKNGHPDVVRNPSDPSYWDKACGDCHKKEIEDLKASLHFTLKGIRSSTLGMFGAEGKQKEVLLSQVGQLFLQDNCLDCHLSNSSHEYGFIRSTGCAACHVSYNEGGTYEGKDTSLRGSRRIRARYHRFQRAIEINTCISCHRKNHVGSDYLGLFERDLTRPFDMSNFREGPYRDYHRLTPDVHYQKGLRCVDCHKKEDVMGDGIPSSFALERTKVTCQDCHERPKGIPHDIKGHERLHCASCHAQWVFGDYGLSIMGNELEGSKVSWQMGYRFRRWEWISLGFDHEGLLRPLRPKYQYLITWIDKKGNLLLDSFIPQRKGSNERGWCFTPYTPHTIQKGRTCDACHGNLMATGRGLCEDLSQDTYLTKAYRPAIDMMRLLGEDEAKRLLSPSLELERLRLKYLFQRPYKGFR